MPSKCPCGSPLRVPTSAVHILGHLLWELVMTKPLEVAHAPFDHNISSTYSSRYPHPHSYSMGPLRARADQHSGKHQEVIWDNWSRSSYSILGFVVHIPTTWIQRTPTPSPLTTLGFFIMLLQQSRNSTNSCIFMTTGNCGFIIVNWFHQGLSWCH